MSELQSILHFTCLVMFAVGFGMNLNAAHHCITSQFSGVLKMTVIFSAASGGLLSILFIILQLDWIISGHNESVGDLTSWSWLVFDYLLAVFLICVAQALTALSHWSNECGCRECRERYVGRLVSQRMANIPEKGETSSET